MGAHGYCIVRIIVATNTNTQPFPFGIGAGGIYGGAPPISDLRARAAMQHAGNTFQYQQSVSFCKQRTTKHKALSKAAEMSPGAKHVSMLRPD